MKKVKAVRSAMVVFNGVHMSIEEGREFEENSPIVQRNRGLFEDVKAPKKEVKPQAKKKESKKEELKEELLVEGPVAEAEIIITD